MDIHIGTDTVIFGNTYLVACILLQVLGFLIHFAVVTSFCLLFSISSKTICYILPQSWSLMFYFTLNF